VNETEFKDAIQRDFWKHKIRHKREECVGTLLYDHVIGRNTGISGFADFASHSGKWFVECKLKPSAAEVSRGLGQCLFYKRFLKGYQGFLVYPKSEDWTFGSDQILNDLCAEYGIHLCDETGLARDIRRWINGKEPFSVALSKFIDEHKAEKGWDWAFTEFYRLNEIEPEPEGNIHSPFPEANPNPKPAPGNSLRKMVLEAAGI
jgi:hypothetical protein